MSAKQCFALCIDCWEMHYGVTDRNGVYTRDSESSNHADHAVHVFGAPNDYPPPIRSGLVDLHAGRPISDSRMEIFSLACAIHALQPTNGRAVRDVDIIPTRSGGAGKRGGKSWRERQQDAEDARQQTEQPALDMDGAA